MTELTDRQAEILALLNAGEKATKIADQLGITRNAVYQQIQAIKRKGALDHAFTPSGELRVPAGQDHMMPTLMDAGALIRVIESQQHTIAQQADTCAKLADKLSGRPKNR